MKLPIDFRIPALIGLSLLLTVCAQPSDTDQTDLLSTEFTGFQLTTEDNPGLPVSIYGTLDGDTVILQYPDTMIPGFHWIPRFYTPAASVEIDGVPQISGSGSVDFSTPVTYTLTSSTGFVRNITVELILNPGWHDLGDDTAFSLVSGAFNIRSGLMSDINPYAASYDDSGDMRLFLMGIPDGIWSEYDVGQPSSVVSFDALSWESRIWVVYETSGSTVEAQYSVPPDTWSGVLPLTATAGTRDLRIFKGSEDRIFASWIEDPVSAASPVVWTTDTSAVWEQVVGPLSSFHADSMAAASAGGTGLYAVCTFSENPGTLHLFTYDYNTDSWSMTQGGGSLFKEDSQTVFALFYDEDVKAPVVFTLLPSSEDPGFYILRALYWNSTAGVWTNMDYIQPLTVSAGSVTTLSISWFDNTPSVAAGSSVLTWDGNRWKSVGTYTSNTPAGQSLTTGILDTFMVAYTTDPGVGSLDVRLRQ